MCYIFDFSCSCSLIRRVYLGFAVEIKHVVFVKNLNKVIDFSQCISFLQVQI
jgi:hypothetical protein